MTEPEGHREPFIHLVELTHDRVLIGWGAFWFTRTDADHRWEIVDDEGLRRVAGRRTCIGASAEPFGMATVRVLDTEGRPVAEASTDERAWTWVEGLAPDTPYRYEVIVDGEPWAAGERHDWVPSGRGGLDLGRSGRKYDLRFRTHPAPDASAAAMRFVAIGDYGVGTRSDSESSRRQRRIGDVLDALVTREEVRFVVSLGDNVYQGEHGQVDQESGAEDDDWYSSFYEPYRYAIARVPFYPTIGNHDGAESEAGDDRAQLEDNFHFAARFDADAVEASTDPGLFYRLRFGRDLELVCLDTSHDTDAGGRRMFEVPKHRRWLEEVFARDDVRWRIPFCHHPTLCAGPENHDDEAMLRELVPLFRRAGVRLTLAGHEHNFQAAEADGITHVISGAAGKSEEKPPGDFAGSSATMWGGQAHLLVVHVTDDRLEVTPFSGLMENGSPHPMTALSPSNEVLYPPFSVTRG
jgi:tartrate-resistant acid phosphatase type 5